MERLQLSIVRKRSHLTLKEIADRVGVNRSTVQRWERGSIPQPLHLRMLCEIFNTTAQELGFGGNLITTEQITETKEETASDVLALFRKQDITMRLMAIVWAWPVRNYHYHRLQALLSLELEGNTYMTPDELISRRDALRRLALLPIEMSGLTAFGATLSRPTEEVLTQCSAGITACWYLRKGKELTFAANAISYYIPTLKAIAASASSAQRKVAADLLAQCLLLKSTLSRFLGANDDALSCIQQAETYGEQAGNLLLRILSARTQAATHYYANRWGKALQSAEKAGYLLETADAPISPRAASYVYAGLATYQACNGQKQQALASLGKAHTTFFNQSPGDDPPVWVDHYQANLVLNDGMTHYHLGLHRQALDSFAQTKSVPTTESGRVEILIDQVMAEVSRDDQPRNLDWCVDLWKQGIEGAKALQSQQRFDEAMQAYRAMCVAWPGEKRVKELRDYIN